MNEITFIFNGKEYYLKPDRGDYKVIRKEDGWEAVTVSFNEYQGFMAGHRWIRECEIIIANEAIKAYWKVHTRKEADWNTIYYTEEE